METKPTAFVTPQLSTRSQAQFRLIKVPQFLADEWNESTDQKIVGCIEKCPKTGRFIIRKENSKQNGTFELTSQAPQPSRIAILQKSQNNQKYADLITCMEQMVTFVPVMNTPYFKLLQDRNQRLKQEAERPTKIENEVLGDMENRAMLFQYYRPNTDPYNENTYPGSMDTSRAYGFNEKKIKGKRSNTMDGDSTKMVLFKMFELAGDEGLQLKQIVKETKQPQNYIKSIIEEIAEIKKRPSDRKTVYFLKDWYKGFVGAEPEDETPVKRIKKS